MRVQTIALIPLAFAVQIDYLHRTGRTARMGAKGSKISTDIFVIKDNKIERDPE